MQNLAALIDELPLFARIARFLYRTGKRNHVAGDRLGPDIARGDEPVDGRSSAQRLGVTRELVPLRVEFGDPGGTGTGYGLVGGDHHAIDSGGAMQRCERGDEHHRRAVRTRGDPSRQNSQVFGIHFRDHEWHIGFHAKGSGVVHDACARSCGHRCPLERQRVINVHDDDVQTVEAAVTQDLAGDLTISERKGSTFRSRRRVRTKGSHRERTLLEYPQHLLADEARRPDHTDINRHDVALLTGEPSEKGIDRPGPEFKRFADRTPSAGQ